MPNKTYTLEEREEQIDCFMKQIDRWRDTTLNIPDVLNGPIIFIELTPEQEQVIRATRHAVEGMRTIFRETFGYQ